MADKSTIEWTDTTWNPVTGCTKISAGCDNCYAARFSERFRGVPGHPFENGFDLTVRPERLTQPLDWKKPRMIFVNSMSDLFHKDGAESAHRQGLRHHGTCRLAHLSDAHEAQLAAAEVHQRSLQNQAGAAAYLVWRLGRGCQARRASLTCRSANAAVRFLSVEPLIGPVGKLNLAGINWVIVGGESGPHARPMQTRWAIDVRNQCLAAKVAFFFKQWGGRSPKSGGRLLEGQEWNQFPAALPASARNGSCGPRA